MIRKRSQRPTQRIPDSIKRHPTLLLLEPRTAQSLMLALRIRFWLGVVFGASAAALAWAVHAGVIFGG